MRKYLVSFSFIVMLGLAVFLLLSPADTESILAENREVKQFPTVTSEQILSGAFSKEFEEFVDDNIGFRSKLMNISDAIKSCFGYVPEDGGKIITTTSDIGTGESLDGRLVIYQGKIMEMFTSKPDVEQKYADTLNFVRSSLPENVAMYSMLVPTALEFSDPMYAQAQDSQKAAIDNVYSKLNNITPVDIYGKLIENTQQQPNDYLYFNTDHHWTMDGAYCGYRAFMETTGETVLPKTMFTRKSNGDFYGSLYLKAKSELNKDTNDTVFYYDTTGVYNFDMVMRAEDAVTEYGVGAPIYNLEKHDYLLFFGGDQPLMEITNNSIESGKTLVVIKDSYANAMLPWVINNYKKVVVIDPRSFGGSLIEEVNRYNADEVAVINYVFTTTFADYCDMITGLIK